MRRRLLDFIAMTGGMMALFMAGFVVIWALASFAAWTILVPTSAALFGFRFCLGFSILMGIGAALVPDESK